MTEKAGISAHLAVWAAPGTKSFTFTRLTFFVSNLSGTWLAPARGCVGAMATSEPEADASFVMGFDVFTLGDGTCLGS